MLFREGEGGGEGRGKKFKMSLHLFGWKEITSSRRRVGCANIGARGQDRAHVEDIPFFDF